MRRLGVLQWMLVVSSLVAGLGAAPAAPSYSGVDRVIGDLRAQWTKPGARPEPNAPGWNAFFDALISQLKAYASAPTANDRLVALNQVYKMSVALRPVSW